MSLSGTHPVLTCDQAKGWEAGLLTTESAEWAAMQQAGEALAAAITEDFQEIGGMPGDARILVLLGKGHNGGDALLAARSLLLVRPEARVVMVACFGLDRLRPLTRRSLELLLGDAPDRVVTEEPEQALAPERDYSLCLDGVFGFQFRTPMDTTTTGIISAVNVHPRIRLRAAVDLPSGMGETSAPLVFRADFTYATGIIKQPVLQTALAACTGRLRYLDLGFFEADLMPAAAERILTLKTLAPLEGFRASQSDKRSYGHLLVVGGSRSYPGAVLLAVRAALRSGVGLVTAFVPETLAPEFAAKHPEAMWVGCPQTATGGMATGTVRLIRERLSRATALLIGPGLGAETETMSWVASLAAESAVPIVLDADALRPEVVAGVIDRPFVCTPHAGEFQRIAPQLFPGDRFIGRHGVLVLKGPMTRVTDGRTTYHSPFGGPVLARGGSGDLLAGLIGGLLAQNPADPLTAACRGVVWHGRAADLLARLRGQVAVELTELLELLGPALHP